MPLSVTYKGLVGQSAFSIPFLADTAADLSVSVGGSPTSAFTYADRTVTLTTPLATAQDVVISDILEDAIPLAQAVKSLAPRYIDVVLDQSSNTLTQAIETDGFFPARIIMPATWTAANLTFQTSADKSSYSDLYDEYGVEKTVVAAAGRAIALNPADWVGVQAMKIRSGTSGTPVSQASARTIRILLIHR